MKMNKAQVTKLKELYDRSTQRRTMSFRQYRRTVHGDIGYAKRACVWFCNMYGGIETDGRFNT